LYREGGLEAVATQRLTVATLAGQAAIAVAARFEQWREVPNADEVDRFCAALYEHAHSLPVVYFAEWIDRWLMGDVLPGPGAVHGRRFEATCLSPEHATDWADRCGNQFAEQEWLAARLREAAVGWGTVAQGYGVIVMREVVGASTTDEEVRAALSSVPAWLSLPDDAAEPKAASDRGAPVRP
jgi:hypothetical protein